MNKTVIKKAGAGRRPAERNKLQNRVYPKPAQLSSLRYKMHVEIGGLVGALNNPFLSQVEKEICNMLFYSTMRKLLVLQNDYCSGCGCAESISSKRSE